MCMKKTARKRGLTKKEALNMVETVTTVKPSFKNAKMIDFKGDVETIRDLKKIERPEKGDIFRVMYANKKSKVTGKMVRVECVRFFMFDGKKYRFISETEGN